ncbi:MAG: Subunit of the glycosylphosphatidylinositol transamidase complex-like protein [Icmadophila ericetorum]|nr:Subunit of the glycosylphosphatidylinositol transamidase complex-like protein [Icmadophila ericetorum]
MIFHFFLLCFLQVIGQLAVASGDYHEQLLLQPLLPSSLLASFNFRSNASLSSFNQQHFRYFPRSLGQILQHAKTRELHLRFSTGRWDAECWGARPWGGVKEGGTGVELWAWVEAETEKEAFARWITLNHALSGLFCASLNFIDSTRTIRPVMTFEPLGDHLDTSNLHLLHGTLPHEVVCTENLTPFLKLLPCKGRAGISSLLDGHKLFDASWQTMAIDVRPLCPAGGSECVVEMEQTVDMVLDIERSKRPRDNPIPRPIRREDLLCDSSKSYPTEDACYPLDVSQHQSWGLSEVFGRPIKGSCLDANSSYIDDQSVTLRVPSERDVYISGGALEHKDPGGYSRSFTLPSSLDFDMMLPQQDLNYQSVLSQPPLYAERSFTGHGQERGGVQAILTNPSKIYPVEFIYLESLPWFMKPYLHTLEASLSGKRSAEKLIKDIYYRPAVDRSRGTHLEIHLSVPAASTVILTYDFEKAILRYTEYPPDANRGFDVAPAVIRLLSNNSSKSVYLRTTSLLLPLPTPDFSMPYNVIILTSTVIALAFGSIYNLLVRRFVGADEAGVGFLQRLKDKIRPWIAKQRERGTEKKTQ